MKFKDFPVPNTTLTNIEIDDWARKLNLKDYCPHRMRDELIGKAKENECGIINTDESSGKGFHYVAYFKRGNTKIYFDSFGLNPLIEVQRYLGINILCSDFRIQKLTDTNCGKYCLYVLYKLNNGNDFKDLILDLLEEQKFEGV
jgi:hypothetical protein